MPILLPKTNVYTMRQQITHLLIVLLSLVFNPAFSQNAPVSVKITGTPHREPLNVFSGQTRLQLCGLTAGNTYQVIAVGAYPGEKAAFRLTMAVAQQENIARPQSRADRPELRRFKATASCVDLLLETQGAGNNMEVPLSLSVGCLDCAETFRGRDNLLQNVADGPPPSNLVVTQGETPGDLVTNVLIGLASMSLQDKAAILLAPDESGKEEGKALPESFAAKAPLRNGGSRPRPEILSTVPRWALSVDR